MKRITLLSGCLGSLLITMVVSLAGPLSGQATAAAMGISQTQEHGAKIETKYDGFNQETVVTLKKMRITCRGGKGLGTTVKDTCVSIVASLHSPGLQLDYVRYARLQLIFETKAWDKRHNPDQRELVAVADGERLKLGTMRLVKQDVDTDRLIEVMKEVLEVSIPYETFNKLARSQTLEMRVGDTQFELQDKNLAAFRDLNNRVKI